MDKLVKTETRPLVAPIEFEIKVVNLQRLQVFPVLLQHWLNNFWLIDGGGLTIDQRNNVCERLSYYWLFVNILGISFSWFNAGRRTQCFEDFTLIFFPFEPLVFP